MTFNLHTGSMSTVKFARQSKSGGSMVCFKTKRSFGFLILIVVVVVYIAIYISNTATSRSPVRQTYLLSVRRHSQSNLNHLVDIHEYAVRQNTQGESVIAISRPDRETHSILWYNKPVWITLKSVEGKCEYNNCKMTDDPADISSHSAIVFTLTHGLDLYPPRTSTRKDQLWILFYQEPPYHLYKHTNKLFSFDKWRYSFNWTMSYRLDSDIPLPYGTLVTRRKHVKRNYRLIYQRKRKFAVWVVGNCGAISCRDEYVYELRKHGIQVDVFEVCGYYGNWTPRSQLSRMLNTDYKYYFAFENSLCRDYITEKFFNNYNFDIVLVVRGGANYERLLPKGGFIDSSKFQSPKELADYLIKVDANESMYTDYLRIKDLYQAFSSDKVHEYSFCKLCEKLNNKHDNVNVYDNILNFVYQNNHCTAPTDVECRIFTKAVIVLIICSCIFIFIFAVFMYKYLPQNVF